MSFPFLLFFDFTVQDIYIELFFCFCCYVSVFVCLFFGFVFVLFLVCVFVFLYICVCACLWIYVFLFGFCSVYVTIMLFYLLCQSIFKQYHVTTNSLLKHCLVFFIWHHLCLMVSWPGMQTSLWISQSICLIELAVLNANHEMQFISLIFVLFVGGGFLWFSDVFFFLFFLFCFVLFLFLIFCGYDTLSMSYLQYQ